MDERLLLPVTPALLDGWCGPVVHHYPGAPDHPGVWYDGCLTPGQERHGRVSLDLARAECRDRVARVVGRHPAMDGDLNLVTAPRFWCGWIRDEPRWHIETETIVRRLFDGRRWGSSAGFSWDLADLDPHDDTRLPDGSRLVDALALAAVAREVL